MFYRISRFLLLLSLSDTLQKREKNTLLYINVKGKFLFWHTTKEEKKPFFLYQGIAPVLHVWREGKGQWNAEGPGAVMTELSLFMFCSFNCCQCRTR